MMRLAFSSPPIAFHRELAIALGGIYEALLFQQLAYWSDRGTLPDGWIYKTGAELSDETTMNRYQLDKARGNLMRLGVIEAERRGVPATMHYRVVWDRLYGLLRATDDRESPKSGVAAQFVEGEQTGLSKVSKLDCPPSTNWSADPARTGLVTDGKPVRSPSTISNRNREYAETTQRTRGSEHITDNVADAPPPTPMTPEQRLAQFEATQAQLARLKGLA